ncbi:MAG: DUF1439 domain-containing protein [Verrucomicrobiales bacterium]|nr:DUF1439 domain-containing protein [Verrucomicrobiales bacterium]
MNRTFALLFGAAFAAILWSCGRTWEIPVPKSMVIQEITKQFPLEKNGILSVKLADPNVEFDGGRGKIVIHLKVRVSAPLGLAAREGSLTVESGLGYNDAKKSVVLKEPALSQISIAGLDSAKLGQARELIIPLIGKALDGLTAHAFDQHSAVEKLASRHLAGFRITNDDLIIKVK